jgi:hypothetical protein
MVKIVQAKDGSRWMVAETAEWPSAGDDMSAAVAYPERPAMSQREALQCWIAAFERVIMQLRASGRIH